MEDFARDALRGGERRFESKRVRAPDRDVEGHCWRWRHGADDGACAAGRAAERTLAIAFRAIALLLLAVVTADLREGQRDVCRDRCPQGHEEENGGEPEQGSEAMSQLRAHVEAG